MLVERISEDRRELARPDAQEISTAEDTRWVTAIDLGAIPAGRETKVLLRHGFELWGDIYPDRQKWVTERLLDLTNEIGARRAGSRALRMAILGSTEMAGLLSRWDRWYLKACESMAGHRFNFTTLSVEPNVWGVGRVGRGTARQRVRLFARAADWFKSFSIGQLKVDGPLPSASRRTALKANLDARVVIGSSERIVLQRQSTDLVLTDPPYYDQVQYGELSLPLRAWSNLSSGDTRREAVVVNGHGENSSGVRYRSLLAAIFQEVARILKPTGHFILSYANRDPQAWVDLFSAFLDAGFSPAGYNILLSESSNDVSKRGVRACQHSMILDLVPNTDLIVEPWTPPLGAESHELQFLELVGSEFMKLGSLRGNWEAHMIDRLQASPFIRPIG